MQVPFDQIMGKSSPLKLPDVAAVEAGCFLGLNAVVGSVAQGAELRGYQGYSYTNIYDTYSHNVRTYVFYTYIQIYTYLCMHVPVSCMV